MRKKCAMSNNLGPAFSVGRVYTDEQVLPTCLSHGAA